MRYNEFKQYWHNKKNRTSLMGNIEQNFQYVNQIETNKETNKETMNTIFNMNNLTPKNKILSHNVSILSSKINNSDDNEENIKIIIIDNNLPSNPFYKD